MVFRCILTVSYLDVLPKKGECQPDQLHGSPVSSTLAAAIVNSRYVNALPLYRLEQELRCYGLAITRQNMANWMIRLGEEYLSVLYDHLHQKLYDYHVIQADETPVLVTHDGRPAGSKSYMWVYRSGYMYPEKQIALYEYQRTRNASLLWEFLTKYSGSVSQTAIRSITLWRTRRKTRAASGGHPATGRCFVCVPETEKPDRGKR